MESGRVTFAFDFVDPGSYLVRELMGRRWGPALSERVRMLPLELRPPPRPLIPPGEPEWREMERSLARVAEAEEIPFDPPAMVPWTRKAHELALHARERDREDRMVDLLFRGRFRRRLDLGRVDVLISLAEEAGLDGPEVRTVLGVDRFTPAVDDARAEALSGGIRGVPTLVDRSRRLEGFRSPEELDAFLREAEAGGAG